MKYSKEKLEEINKLLEKYKKSLSTVIPNDFYQNKEINNNDQVRQIKLS